MPALCCGIIYSKKDINTYWCINTDIISTSTERVGKDKVYKEIVETYQCKKCGATIVKRYLFKKSGKLLQTQRYTGQQALEYLNKTSNTRRRQPQEIPFVKTSGAKTIPFIYGAVVDKDKQRPRYLNGDWAGDTITAKVKLKL